MKAFPLDEATLKNSFPFKLKENLFVFVDVLVEFIVKILLMALPLGLCMVCSPYNANKSPEPVASIEPVIR